MPALSIANQSQTLASALSSYPPAVDDTVSIHGTAADFPGDTFANNLTSLTFAPTFTGTIGKNGTPLTLGASGANRFVKDLSASNYISINAGTTITELILAPTVPGMRVLGGGVITKLTQGSGHAAAGSACDVQAVEMTGGTLVLSAIASGSGYAAVPITQSGGQSVIERDVSTLTLSGPMTTSTLRSPVETGMAAVSPVTLNINNGATCQYDAAAGANVNSNGGTLDCSKARGVIAFGTITATGPLTIRYAKGLKPTATVAETGAGRVDWVEG